MSIMTEHTIMMAALKHLIHIYETESECGEAQLEAIADDALRAINKGMTFEEYKEWAL